MHSTVFPASATTPCDINAPSPAQRAGIQRPAIPSALRLPDRFPRPTLRAHAPPPPHTNPPPPPPPAPPPPPPPQPHPPRRLRHVFHHVRPRHPPPVVLQIVPRARPADTREVIVQPILPREIVRLTRRPVRVPKRFPRHPRPS